MRRLIALAVLILVALGFPASANALPTFTCTVPSAATDVAAANGDLTKIRFTKPDGTFVDIFPSDPPLTIAYFSERYTMTSVCYNT